MRGLSLGLTVSGRVSPRCTEQEWNADLGVLK